MKIRVYKKELRGMLMWYTHAIQENFQYKPLTPSLIEQIKSTLLRLQHRKQMDENNNIWNIPVGILIDHSQQQIEVIISDESNILYIDFDQP